MSGCECACSMETFYRICNRNGLKDLRNKYYEIFHLSLWGINDDDEEDNDEYDIFDKNYCFEFSELELDSSESDENSSESEDESDDEST